MLSKIANTESTLKNKSIRPFFQPKLTINQPNDVYEQEADHMADRVMRMPDPNLSQNAFFKPAVNHVQRKCQACEEEEKHVHRKENNSGEVGNSAGLDNYVSSLSSSGQTMSASSRQFFEPQFGHDFSNVKIHTDSVAAKSAQSINALAYTTGNNIVFNSGQYSPESGNGKKLMAHELTHVVQQRTNIQPQLIQRQETAPMPVASDPCLIHFVQGRTEFTNAREFAACMARIRTYLAGGSDRRVTLNGYASAEGSSDFNMDLSKRRGETVLSLLKSAHIDGSRIDVIPHGEDSSFPALGDNRRVEVVLPGNSTAPTPDPSTPASPTTPSTPAQSTPAPTTPPSAPTGAPDPAAPAQADAGAPAPDAGASTPNCPVACKTPIVLFSDTTNCGTGDDFLNNDRPGGPRSATTNLLVSSVYSKKTDPELLIKMKTGVDGIGTIAGAPGIAAADHFFTGPPTPVDHDISTPIGAAANRAPSFNATASAVETAFHTIITGMAATPASNNCASYALASPAVPRVNFPMTKKELAVFEATPTSWRSVADTEQALLKAVIGGTHGIEIVLTALSIDCNAHTYTATIHYKICDNFGVDDTNDLYSDSLIAFWVLQHMRPGHNAFINNILLDRTITNSF
jgi:outer membrane protein OmpA-like peptidoglycan-associated protein